MANTASFETSENDLHIYLEMKSLGCQVSATTLVKRAKIEPQLQVLENPCEKKSLKLQGNLAGGALRIRNASGTVVKEMLLGKEAQEVVLEHGIYQLEYNHSQAACQQKAFSMQVAIQECIVSSTADEALARASSVYPNPTKDRLQVRIQDLSRGKVGFKIYSLQGLELQNWNVQKQSQNLDYELDMSRFAQGVYLLEIRTEQGIAHKRVVKD